MSVGNKFVQILKFLRMAFANFVKLNYFKILEYTPTDGRLPMRNNLLVHFDVRSGLVYSKLQPYRVIQVIVRTRVHLARQQQLERRES